MIKKMASKLLTVVGAGAILFGGLWLITQTPIWPFPLFEWEYEELSRIESPDGQFEIVPFRGNAGAVSGYAYDLFVVPKGKSVKREADSQYCVFIGYEDTRLKNYKWQDKTVEIEIGEGVVGRYKTYYGIREDYSFKKVGDVTLEVKKIQ